MTVSFWARPVKLKLDLSENNRKFGLDSESCVNKIIVEIPTEGEVNKMWHEVSHHICETPTNKNRLSLVQRRRLIIIRKLRLQGRKFPKKSTATY